MRLTSFSLIVLRPRQASRLALQRLYEFAHPREPWISPASVRFCEQVLAPDMIALEWGSGRSTRWFAKHVGRLTSVEHSADWYAKVGHELRSLPNVDYRHVPLEHDEAAPSYPHYDVLPKYVAVATSFRDASLDFVVVDGHYRQACVLAALPKLRPNGLLLIDNSNWLSPRQWGVPESYSVVHHSEYGRGTTTIWRKPPL